MPPPKIVIFSYPPAADSWFYRQWVAPPVGGDMLDGEPVVWPAWRGVEDVEEFNRLYLNEWPVDEPNEDK